MKLKIWNKQQGGPTRQTLAAFLRRREAGPAQRRGHLELIPLFGSAVEPDTYAPPESALRLKKASDYGVLELRNRRRRPTIVPLHVGFFQRKVQNHAMCVAWVLRGLEERTFTDACCIQEAQGGYLREVEQRFIILPHALRAEAYASRGRQDYSKLWRAITRFNKALGLEGRGHLDELKQHRQAALLRTTYHLELQRGQTGAVFLCQGEVVGVELAPDAAFYAELHRPLVMYCYAPLRLALEPREVERRSLTAELPDGPVSSVAELRAVHDACRRSRELAVAACLARLAELPLQGAPCQSEGEHRLLDLTAGGLVGQGVLLGDAPAYLSLVG